MRRLALASILCSLACAADLNTEAIVGTWELQEVAGETCTVLPGGELEVNPDYSGTFEWTYDCGTPTTEIGAIQDFSIERVGVEYSFNLQAEMELYDWECQIDGTEMDCNETRGNGELRIFKFLREPNP